MAYSTVVQLEHDWVVEAEWSGRHSNPHRLALVGVVMVVVHWLPEEEAEEGVLEP